MNFSDKNMKKIINLIIFTGITLWCVLNYHLFVKFILLIIKLITPLLVGVAIAFIINVPMKKIEKNIFKIDKRKHKKPIRILSLIMSILLIFGILALILFLVIPEVVQAVISVGNTLPKNLDFINDIISKAEDLYPSIEGYVKHVDIQNIVSKSFDSATVIVNFIIGFLSSMISKVVTFFLGFVLSIYLLIDKEGICNQLTKLVTAFCSEKVKNKIIKIAKLTNATFSNFITGQCTDAVLTGTILFIILSIFKIPYALIIAVLFTITALIPYVGAFIALVLGTLLIAVVSPVKALWYIVIFFVVQQFDDNFTYPKIVGKSVGLPAIWALVALLLGGSLLGFIGMIISIPIASIIYALFKDYVNERIEEKAQNKVDKKN